MFDVLWWHWAVLGFGCLLAELMLPAFILVWFGLAAFVVTAVVLLAPDMPLSGQILLWTLGSLGMMFAWFRVFKKGDHKSMIGRSSANLVGETGMIAEAVAPFKQGKVRFQKPMVGSDIWACMADEEIAAGTRVRVQSVEGNTVFVKKLEG